MLVVLGALKEEIAGIKRKMVIEEAYTEQGYIIYRGKYIDKELLLAHTGIGKGKAERTAKYVLEHYQIRALICIGFAGALVKGLEVGDVVLGSAIHCGDKQMLGNLELQSPFYSDNNLLSITSHIQENAGFQFEQASIVTVLNPICQPEAKLELGKAFSSKAVDMESYWIANIALAKCIPFLSIRVISDTAEDRLLPFDRFLDSGNWRWKSAALYFLTHPQRLPELFNLYRNTRLARKNLTGYMDSFISKL